MIKYITFITNISSTILRRASSCPSASKKNHKCYAKHKALAPFFLCIFRSLPILNLSCLTFSNLPQTYLRAIESFEIWKAQHKLY